MDTCTLTWSERYYGNLVDLGFEDTLSASQQGSSVHKVLLVLLTRIPSFLPHPLGAGGSME